MSETGTAARTDESYPGPKRPLTDRLAYDRTVMANDRSLLAFARTGLTLVVTGLAFLKLLEGDWSQRTGWTLVAVAPAVVGFGLYRFVQLRRRYEREMREPPG